jgi:hypothetical protein
VKLIHPIDAASGLVFRFGPRRVFQDGWGDRGRLDELRQAAGRLPPLVPLDLRWSNERRTGELRVRDAAYRSPVEGLADGTGTGHLRLILPPDGTDRLCLLMASWNDHAFATRTGLATGLARLGIGSVLLENPYYGKRRPAGVAGPPIRTVVDFMTMGYAAVVEGRAALAALQSGAGGRLGVSGYSMGGNIAALISSTMPFPVATAPLAPSHSPGPVFTTGALRFSLDRAALGNDGLARLAGVLGDASVLRFEPPLHAAAAVLVAASLDGYIPRPAVEALHRHWPGSELRWVTAGHATLLWRRRDELVRAIVDSFDRLHGGRNPDGRFDVG